MKSFPLLALLTLCLCATVGAEEAPYPSKAVKVIVPASAGGPTDIVARLVSERLSTSLQQPFVVDNRPGASTTIGAAAVVAAKPDGLTLLISTADPITVAPLTMKGLPYDASKDLAAVSHIGTAPLVIYVNSALPVHDVKDLIAYAKSAPNM